VRSGVLWVRPEAPEFAPFFLWHGEQVSGGTVREGGFHVRGRGGRGCSRERLRKEKRFDGARGARAGRRNVFWDILHCEDPRNDKKTQREWVEGVVKK